MPIRFRCVYCNQLMGIARRKGGTVVKCPTCNGQVVVPGSDAERTEQPQKEEGSDPKAVAAAAPAAAAASAPAAVGPGVFEQSDFEDVLREPEPKPRPKPAEPAPPKPAPPTSLPSPTPDVERSDVSQLSQFSTGGQVGVVLSPARLALLIVIFILLLALAFGAGIVVGKNLAG